MGSVVLSQQATVRLPATRRKVFQWPPTRRTVWPSRSTERSDTEEAYIGLTPSDDENCLEELPFVDVNSFISAGWGPRNGCTFKANWDGMDVAIKQLDVTKNPGSYEQELDAYAC
jgi:hypothetical protein